MPLIQEKDREYLQKLFADEFKGDVRMLLFTRQDEKAGGDGEPSGDCPYCQAAVDLTREMEGLSDKLKVEVHDLNKDGAEAAKYGVDKVPTFVILDPKGHDHGVRFYGLPAGMEFSVLIADLMDMSKEQTRLAEPTKDSLKGIDKDVNIEVFVTPT
ncbi:MAG: hypothetical protein ACYC9Q_02425 [Bacillota bacterium]